MGAHKTDSNRSVQHYFFEPLWSKWKYSEEKIHLFYRIIKVQFSGGLPIDSYINLVHYVLIGCLIIRMNHVSWQKVKVWIQRAMQGGLGRCFWPEHWYLMKIPLFWLWKLLIWPKIGPITAKIGPKYQYGLNWVPYGGHRGQNARFLVRPPPMKNPGSAPVLYQWIWSMHRTKVWNLNKQNNSKTRNLYKPKKPAAPLNRKA